MCSRVVIGVLATMGLAVVALAPAAAGPVFDRYLNYAVVEQRCPADNERSDGLVLAVEKKVITLELKKEQPIGQTIKLGPKAAELWTISTGLSRETGWDEGEDVTFTLYDSPAKTKKLYSRTIPYKQKWHKWDVPFNIYLPTKPGATYYYEFTHNGGGDNAVGVIAVDRDDYKNGQAYVGGAAVPGKDLYFQITTKPKNDRKANMKRFLDQFDFTRPELAAAKKACDKGDYDAACAAVLKAFEAHLRKADWISYPKPDTKVSTLAMDYVCDEGRIYHHAETKDEWIEMTGRTTWREAWMGTADFIRQNDLFAELGWVYNKTRNEKYAKKLSGLMLDYAQDNAAPSDGGIWGAKWNTMGVGWRLNDAWSGYARAIDSKSLTPDVRLAWIDYNARMARQVQLGESGGNQANSVADSMMQFSSHFPVFRGSKMWFQQGFDLLVGNSLKIFRDDGGCTEPAMNYHGYSLATLLSGMKIARGFGMDIPQELKTKLEKALVYTSYILKPDGQIPTYGDTDCEEFRPNQKKWNGFRDGEPMRAYELFGREDCLFIATTGKKGKRPEATSVAFPLTGSYVMRSDWGGENGAGFEDARYLLLRGGKFGSHGHRDMNEVMLYAYGRPLLLDPGRTDYDNPLIYELAEPRSHNVLLVDGQRMNRPGPVLHAWHTTGVMDFADNGYIDLYPGVDHRRAVVFVRPDYYVVFDTATAKSPCKMGINFWLTPPEAKIDRAAMTVSSTEPNGANVLLKVLGDGIELADRKGTLDCGGMRSDIPVVTFWRNNATSLQFATVMYPFPTGAKCEGVDAQRFAVDGGQACVVTTPSGKDIVLYSLEGSQCVIPGKAESAARAALIRLDASGQVRSFALADAKSLSLDGKPLVTSAESIRELAVEYLPDEVRVTCAADVSAEIAALGRKSAMVNGRLVRVVGERFKTQ